MARWVAPATAAQGLAAAPAAVTVAARAMAEQVLAGVPGPLAAMAVQVAAGEQEEPAAMEELAALVAVVQQD